VVDALSRRTFATNIYVLESPLGDLVKSNLSEDELLRKVFHVLF